MPCSSAKWDTVIFVSRMKQYLKKNPPYKTKKTKLTCDSKECFKDVSTEQTTGTDDVNYTVLNFNLKHWLGDPTTVWF